MTQLVFTANVILSRVHHQARVFEFNMASIFPRSRTLGLLVTTAYRTQSWQNRGSKAAEEKAVLYGIGDRGERKCD